jgi:hypothetical protein
LIKVVLKPSEYAMAAYLASVRDYVNKDFGVIDKKMGQDDGFLIGVDGLVGEFGVCKHFNVCPDLSFEPRKGGPDCVISKAKTDVKSTKPGKTNFYIPEWKAKHDIDSYVFCYVNFRTVEILGFLTSQDIFKQDNLEPSPKKGINHYALSIDKLRRIPE